jgi:hypothetical protein
VTDKLIRRRSDPKKKKKKSQKPLFFFIFFFFPVDPFFQGHICLFGRIIKPLNQEPTTRNTAKAANSF